MKILLILLAVSLMSCGKNEKNKGMIAMEKRLSPISSFKTSSLVIMSDNLKIELETKKYQIGSNKLEFRKFTDEEILALLKEQKITLEVDIIDFGLASELKLINFDGTFLNEKVSDDIISSRIGIELYKDGIKNLIAHIPVIEIQKIKFSNHANEIFEEEYTSENKCAFGEIGKEEFSNSHCQNFRIIERKFLTNLEVIVRDSVMPITVRVPRIYHGSRRDDNYTEEHDMVCYVTDRTIEKYERVRIPVTEQNISTFLSANERYDEIENYKFVDQKMKFQKLRPIQASSSVTTGFISLSSCKQYYGFRSHRGSGKDISEMRYNTSYDRKIEVESEFIRLNY